MTTGALYRRLTLFDMLCGSVASMHVQVCSTE